MVRTAADTFSAQLNAIDAQLALLTAHVAAMRQADPTTLHWGHVGDAASIAHELQAITDLWAEE